MASRPVSQVSRGRLQQTLESAPKIAPGTPTTGVKRPQTSQIPTIKYHTIRSSVLSNGHESSFPPTPPSNSNESVPQGSPQMSNGTSPRLGRELRRTSHQSSPKYRKLPTPDVTPPASLSPPQRLPSRLASSVAESFRTARESPWLSGDDMSSLGEHEDHWESNHHQAQDLGLGFEAEFENHRQPPISHGVDDIPNREWDTNLMQNITLRPKRKHKIAKLSEEIQPSSVMSRPLDSPRTPTFEDFNQKFPASISAQPRIPAGSPSQSDIATRRLSGLSSSSTIVEAIIISTPPPKPRKLRHVSKTSSLRSEVGSLADEVPRRQSLRASSDSGHLASLQSASKLRSLTEERQSKSGVEHNRQVRISTDPLLRHRRDSYSLRADSALGANALTNGHSRTTSDDAMSTSTTRTDQGGRARSLALGLLQSTSSWSSSGYELPSSNSSSHSRQASRTSSKGKEALRTQSSTYATKSATYRALENALQPAFAVMPSSTDESLVTIIKRPSTASVNKEHTNHTRSSSVNRVDEHVAVRDISSPVMEDRLTVPSITRRASDASGRSFDRSEFGTRTSIDRSTMRSEDHPRHLYSQSTPFSQISDTHSALEVSEAKAVNIYPHNNHSLLLVQQGGPALRSELVSHNQQSLGASVETPEAAPPEMPRLEFQPSTPPPKQEEIVVDSPLKNPREAPQPPTINVLPATPLSDVEDPLAEIHTGPSRRPTILQRARRYSDNLIQPFISRSSTFRRRANSQPPARRRDGTRDTYLHPSWQPRDFWDNLSESDSEWEADDDDDYEPLPAGGDTSEPPPVPLPRRLTQKLPGFRGTGGFLIGNSLNLERHGTNRRRHYVDPPLHFRDSKVTLRRESAEHDRPAASDFANQVRKKQSLGSLRSMEMRRRKMRRRWRILGLQVQYIGVSGIRERWQHKRVAREELKAEKRRDEIRKSIGPKFLVENAPIS